MMVYLGVVYVGCKFKVDLQGGILALAWLADIAGIIGTTIVLYGVFH